MSPESVVTKIKSYGTSGRSFVEYSHVIDTGSVVFVLGTNKCSISAEMLAKEMGAEGAGVCIDFDHAVEVEMLRRSGIPVYDQKRFVLVCPETTEANLVFPYIPDTKYATAFLDAGIDVILFSGFHGTPYCGTRSEVLVGREKTPVTFKSPQWDGFWEQIRDCVQSHTKIIVRMSTRDD